MPNSTPNLGLNLFLENEVFNYSNLNENTNIIDALPIPYDVGTVTSTYTYYSSLGYSTSTTQKTGTATWNYKRYSNNHIELNTLFSISDLGFSIFYSSLSGSSSNWPISTYNEVVVGMPITLSSVYKLGIDIISNNATDTDSNQYSNYYNMWPAIKVPSSGEVTGDVRFDVLSSYSSSRATNQYVIVSIEVKGIEA